MLTISVHNGSRAHRAHNIRDPRVTDRQEHIDKNGHFEIWLDEEPKKAYERIFGDAISEYNQKQKRADRRINNYYRKIVRSDRKHPVYETIVTIGNGHGELPDPADGRAILKRFVDEWYFRNPTLHICGAYYHADEPGAAPHVHIDYIPVYHSDKYGPKKQTGLNRALEQAGFRYKNRHLTPQIQWQNRERQVLEKMCNQRGYTIEHPKRKEKHLETQLFKTKQELATALKRYNAVLAATGLAVKIVKEIEREAEQQQEQER